MDNHFDILIKEGTIIDGTDVPSFIADIGIIKGKIKKIGKRPRIEIGPINYSEEKMKEYIDLGVKDFSLPTDIIIIHQWIKQNAKVISSLFK